jgi:plastocyanin
MSDTVDERTTAPEPAPPPPPEGPRGLPPVAIPIIALAGMLVLVFAASRILLAVSKTSAVVVATFLAANVLIGAAIVSSGRWVRNRPAAFPLLVLGAVMVVAAGAVAWPLSAPEEHGPEGVAVPIVAERVAFTQPEITVPADEALLIEFDNRDAGTQHNVHIGEGEAPPTPADAGLFVGEIIAGPAEITYHLEEGLPPGSYGFICDVHPNMVGTLISVEGAEPPGEGPPPSGPPPSGPPPSAPPPGGEPDVVARDTAFEPTDVSVAPEGGQLTIVFDNEDSLPHNIAVTDGDGPEDAALFTGEFVTADTVEYSFEAPDPGDYYFYCQAHPVMEGTLTVG